jgi:hypothetical protein
VLPYLIICPIREYSPVSIFPGEFKNPVNFQTCFSSVSRNAPKLMFRSAMYL